MDIRRVIRDERQLKAVIGMGKQEFQSLLSTFAESWYVELKLASPDRVRKVGGGKKGALKTMEEKLFAILLYLKTYPTFDVLGFLTNRERTRARRSTHFLLQVLERTLGKKFVLPTRKITSVEEFFEKFPEMKDVFPDGTERPVQRPKDAKKRILILTKSKSGRRHDKRLADKEELFARLPPEVTAWTDTGFQAVHAQHPNTRMPKKATKNHPLTEEERQDNRIISGLRIVAEHAIGGMKRLKAAADIYRNRIPRTDDRFNLLAAGLWNFHLQQTA
ncbi:IS5/IS1182 family transposase [bacterium]|nr:IS5/IS1182 family transposase [bacterium]